jgi:major membrane immunogen (membrane-anchored lipoprotein)
MKKTLLPALLLAVLLSGCGTGEYSNAEDFYDDNYDDFDNYDDAEQYWEDNG